MQQNGIVGCLDSDNCTGSISSETSLTDVFQSIIGQPNLGDVKGQVVTISKGNTVFTWTAALPDAYLTYLIPNFGPFLVTLWAVNNIVVLIGIVCILGYLAMRIRALCFEHCQILPSICRDLL